MATSFKVPSSPAKSIFEIDEFLGVDLTNSGTNINEHRSPNAPNMIRHVPGKVRKRTGYQTDTVFGNGLNTNLAIGASENVDEFELDTETSQNFTVLYDMFIKLSATEEDKNIYLEFDYQADEMFWVTGAGWLEPSPDDFTHYEGWVRIAKENAFARVRAISNRQNQQTIKIKRFLATYQKDNNYRWQKAPNHFVYRESNSPIYGVHKIKHGTFDGNRVVNVNRVKNATDQFVTYNLSQTPEVLFSLYEKTEYNRTVYVDFDYIASDDCTVFFGTNHAIPKSEEVAHYSFSDMVTDPIYLGESLWFFANTDTAIEIKNVSVVYEKDENYQWSQAPEESGKEFHIEDLYFVDSTNYSSIEESNGSYDATGTTKTVSIPIAKSNTPDGSYKLSFSLYAAMRNGFTSLTVKVVNTDNYINWQKTFSDDYTTSEFELYLPAATRHPSRVDIVFTYPSKTYDVPCWISLKNIKLNHLTMAESYYVSSSYMIYHVGSDMYLASGKNNVLKKVLANANQHISQAWQVGEDLIILDGEHILKYSSGASEITNIVEENGYIPLVTISKSPQGGGTPYESINLLQRGFYETFYVKDVPEDEWEGTAFFLTFDDLDNDEVKVWTLSQTGTWIEKKENVDFTVNRGSGIVIFNTFPGKSPLTGEDNVKILAYKTFPGYKDRISKCTIGTLFGVNGASDRLFLSGNPDYPNWDFYSEMNDATYFPDTGYSSLGLSSSAIVGYARVNNYLATFKDEYEPSQSVFIREGDLVTDPDTKVSNPAFKLINTLQGNGVIASHSFGYLQTEPLFLTRSGVYAITAQDITGEKYSQNRSFFLNGQLTKEIGLEDAYAVVHNDMYILAVNGKLYILDGLQPIQTDRSAPYSTRQYVGFYCTDVPALTMWTDDKALWFGTPDGKVCSFATDIEALESYSDNGEPIYCCWETPDLDGKLFYKNKSFRYIAIRMMAALKTSVSLWSMARGAWSFIKEDNNTGIFFDFENIDFEAFSFSTDRSDKVAHSKIRVKKVDKARFKIENGKLNEPFGLMNLALEYVESGNYKG